MSNKDEFNLRDLLGEDAENVLPTIDDTPASELRETDVPTGLGDLKATRDAERAWEIQVSKVIKDAMKIDGGCDVCACEASQLLDGVRLCRFHVTFPKASAADCTDCKHRAAIDAENYIVQGSIIPTLAHPTAPNVSIADLPEVPLEVSPKLADMEDIDEEYLATFNATVAEVKDLSADDLLTLRHRLERMIRRVKIQKNAIKATYEGKLHLVDAKKLKGLKDRDSEFMSGRKVKTEKAAKAPKSPKADAGLTTAEKQVKQFVKLQMDEATIRTTLTSVGTAIPANLEALIAKFKS